MLRTVKSMPRETNPIEPKETLPALSVLDLAPIIAGGTAAQALQNSRSLAQHVERLGYRRFWLAEHHNMPGIASSATAVAIGYVAEGTSTLTVGAGGVMLPNHAPLVIAEQFGTLASLYPGRIDLGVGRAPGTDQYTAYALRRNLRSDADEFPRDVAELISYLDDVREGQHVRATPGAGTKVPVWILGSSLYGAQLAAGLGLPYAFASHFAPQMLGQAIATYRATFRPSKFLDKPHVMAGFNVCAAETDEQAQYLCTSLIQAVINLRLGKPGQLPPPVAGLQDSLSAQEQALVSSFLACSAVGCEATVARELSAFISRTGVDEIIVASQIFDHSARLRSYEILMSALQGLHAEKVSRRAPTSAG
jgi:luciferase family oxidoreductase group 1